MKRLGAALLVAVTVLLVEVTAAPAQVEKVKSRVAFKITPATCPRLAPGTTITGKGRQRSATTTTTDPATGIKTVVNFTRAVGTAADQRGARYTFIYINAFTVTNTVANPGQYAGTMSDAFELTRPGRTKLSNGFVAAYTTDLAAAVTYRRLYAFGDPLDFAAGTSRCDPL